MDQNIIEKFTTHLKSVLVRAYGLAHEEGAPEILPIHLLTSLFSERGSLGLEVLEKSGFSQKPAGRRPVRRERVGASGRAKTVALEKNPNPPNLSDGSKRALEKAVLAASLYEHRYVGTEHLVLGLTQIEDRAVSEILTAFKTDLGAIKEHLASVMKSTSKFPEMTEALEPRPIPGGKVGVNTHEMTIPGESHQTDRRGKSPALDFFTTDLTSAESLERIDPLIGRSRELERMIQILCRRRKNNPILIGEPGVGKTALAEGLARRIAEGTVPDILRGKKIMALDLALIVAGTIYRGEFEGRLKQIIDEIKSRPEVILFIDEVHNLTGAGSASGSMDAANILKPALARGEIRCIGATTVGEYKKSIESDPALDRRFQPITIEEPSAEETEKILFGIRAAYERFHRVAFKDEAISAAVRLAGRYLHDRSFPDKAIDVLDEAAAATRVAAPVSAGERELQAAKNELDKIIEQKERSVREERFNDALELKEKEATLRARLKVLGSVGTDQTPAPEIGTKEIASVISSATGVPLQTVLMTEAEDLVYLEDRLAQKVIGQERVIKEVSALLRRGRAGLGRARGPLSSFLFLGPSGVGKTSLAEAIALEFFHDERAIIRLDMSEFGESFTVSKILGAPAGYVGYRDANRLTDLVRRRPHTVVLFDEVEKAHPDVLNILLQILEDGRLTDSTGRPTFFNEAVVILTSNQGSEKFLRGSLGFGGKENASGLPEGILGEIKQNFRPELVNRLDKILIFNKLSEIDFETIMKKELKALEATIGVRGVGLKVSDQAIKILVEQCLKGEENARLVRRLLQEKIEAPLARSLLSGGSGKKRLFKVDVKKGDLAYNMK